MAKHSTIGERKRRKYNRGILYCNKKRIESRGSGWLGNGWDKKALLDSRPKRKLDFCYAWPR